MADDNIENRPDLNTGKEWSQMDLLDLANCIRLIGPVEEIAAFMCRSRREIRDKIAELHQSGPPAQIRTSPIRASGSYLGCLTAKR
jgi:hypothetical protein